VESPSEAERLNPDARRRSLAPPLFDGRLMLIIVMATSVWGPMRLGEIEALMGKQCHSSNTGRAARFLERLGICVITYRGKTNITVELDRRHPMAMKVRRLGRRLYTSYLAPISRKLPKRTAKQIRYRTPAIPKHEPSTLDMHIFGNRPQMRILHLLAESGSLPAFMVRRLLGTSHAIYKAIRELESAGIVKTRPKGQALYVRLDTSWSGHLPLRALLKALNKHLPEYSAMAAVHRKRRKMHQYSHRLKIRRTRARAQRDSQRRPTSRAPFGISVAQR
jgi:hypothetical protein